MSVRDRRLTADMQKIVALRSHAELLTINYDGPLPQTYTVTYSCRGLYIPAGGTVPVVTNHHVMEAYLHNLYPRFPPRLSWKTPIFHPNILSPQRNGGVCIGSWSPQEGLDQLLIRIGEMVQYKSYNSEDPLDPHAAAWARANAHLLPVDSRPLTRGGKIVIDL